MQLTAIGVPFSQKRRSRHQIFLTMKCTIILLLAACLQVSANGHAQTISVKFRELSFEKALKEVARKSGYQVFYQQAQIKQAKPVSISKENTDVREILNELFKEQPLKYEIANKTIVVSVKEEKKQPESIHQGLSPELTALPPPPMNISGRVTDSTGQPLENVSVFIRGTSKGTRTDAEGFFSLKDVPEGAVIEASLIGYQVLTVNVGTRTAFNNLVMKLKPGEISNVVVKGSTGYQVISKDHPGSFDVINNELLNRSVTTNILDRIRDLTPGVSFDNPNDGLLIRGRNSIFSNVSPLIVLDNFPYDGDINSINPNDIESVTILKDAASAAQWGARAGNGVIVITTKKGKTPKPQVSFNSNITIQNKPDFSSLPIISSADAIDVEKYLFDQGFYNAAITNVFNKTPLSPVQEILLRKRNGFITAAEADALIEPMKTIDFRDDLKNYFYQKAVNRQLAVSVSGNTPVHNYFMSAGWDHSVAGLVGNSNDRVTLLSKNIFKVNSKMSVGADVNYAQGISMSGGNPGLSINSGAGKSLYPYADLVSDNGQALSIVKNFNNSYIDSAGGGNILDWKYRPFDEINASNNKLTNNEFRIKADLIYKLNSFITLDVMYQFHTRNLTSTNEATINAYSTRNNINTFYQPNAINDILKFPIPKGSILGLVNSYSISHQGRANLRFNKSFGSNHFVQAFAGFEIKNLATTGNNYTVYGYNRAGSLVNPNMDFVTSYITYPRLYTTSPVQSTISNTQAVSETLDRFLSYYFNALYSFKNKYNFSSSFRYDAANLFGVKANQQGVPLWSVGAGWQLSKENFYKSRFLPVLTLRATYGYNGNYSRATTALTTATSSVNQLGALQSTIQNPPNSNLRWEQVRMFNVGLDFEFKNRRVYGSFEMYRKSIKDLMGTGPIDPTTGAYNSGTAVPTFFGNLASMKGNGYELSVSALLLKRKLKWETTFVFSYAQTEVTEYLQPPPTTAPAFIGLSNSITPIVGQPLYTMYGYAFAGLDPLTGDPLGYMGKEVSKDYNSIINNTKIKDLIYFGVIQPPYFGAFRNTLSFGDMQLSLNMAYRFGHYFRRNSINYTGLFNSWTGHSDFAKRWKKAGDEMITNVPSMIYPTNLARDLSFYGNSAVLVERGDYISFEDINFSYNLTKRTLKKLPIENIRFYSYISNLNLLLWKANKAGIDPRLNGSLQQGVSYALGLTINF